MTTPTQKGKVDPTKDASRSTNGTLEVTVEIRLAGTRAHVSADVTTLTGASFVSESVTITTH